VPNNHTWTLNLVLLRCSFLRNSSNF
jgi:hypothetical protein